MEEQTKQVDSFIADQVDVMIINLVNSSSADAITQKVKAAKIPCVYINREPSAEDMKAWDKICYVGVDARQSGTYQGEIIRDLPDHGDIDGDGVVRYISILGDPECVDSGYRERFSIKALTDAGIQVEELLVQRGNWEQAKGREVAAYGLAQFGSAVNVIFCNNDGMAMGAIQAIKDAGRTVGKDIYLMGIDAIPEAVDAIASGDMTGTVLNDHVSQAHAAVDAALKYLAGESVDTYIWLNYIKITAENAASRSGTNETGNAVGRNGTIEIGTRDPLRFKAEYEALNGQYDEQYGDQYTDVSIDADNNVVYLTFEELLSFIDGKTGLLFFGRPRCPWCRILAPYMLDFAKEDDVYIYYYNIQKDRDENNEKYKRIISVLAKYLPTDVVTQNEKDEDFDPNLKRVTTPHLFFIKNGEVKSYYDLVESEDLRNRDAETVKRTLRYNYSFIN
jgi:methyl-galactoside transport system substrate-binding protein